MLLERMEWKIDNVEVKIITFVIKPVESSKFNSICDESLIKVVC